MEHKDLSLKKMLMLRQIEIKQIQLLVVLKILKKQKMNNIWILLKVKQ